jgi:outer membrane protein assembly factor BamB
MTVMKTLLFAALGLVLSAVVGTAGYSVEPISTDDSAESILEQSGVSGGLIVHLGCGDGRITESFGRSGRFIVQGLANDPAEVDVSRGALRERSDYGRTSIRLLEGERLPYVDNTVNLLVVEDPLGTDQDEWMRVLAPLGVLMIRDESFNSAAAVNASAGINRRTTLKGRIGVKTGWRKETKPWPDNIDEWTHFLHGPDNNAVAEDSVVGPPRRLQWIAAPKHLRTHEHLNSISAVVSSQGRIFTIIDEGPVSAVIAPPQWRLVARDAFNGVLLWKQDLGPWEGHFRLFRSGPTDIARRLVAAGDKVYATLGYDEPVAQFDAATGELLQTYDASAGTVEILHEDGRLYFVLGEIDEEAWQEAASKFYPTPEPREKSLIAIDAASGDLLWRCDNEDTRSLLPATTALADGRLFLQNTREIVCLDASSGEKLWAAPRPVYTTRLSWSTPTLVVRDGVVLSADGSTGGVPPEARRGEDDVTWIMSDQDIRRHPMGDLVALDAETGESLWNGESLQGFCSPGDVFVVGDRVWAGAKVGTGMQTLDEALSLRSGEVVSVVDDRAPTGGHTKCYRNKATERFLILGGIGVEFVDVDDWSWTSDPWVRGTCQYGVMPCNGLLYVPSDSCACRPNARLQGFTAMAPAAPGNDGPSHSASYQDRLEVGPTFNTPLRNVSYDDAWSTYRNDYERSGATSSRVAPDVKPAWEASLGGKLTALTIGAKNVFVARKDEHTLYALDRATGEVAWTFIAGGPIDSPPSIAYGRVVFGCRDGSVYCLTEEEGELAWRFQAAPYDEMLVAHEQLESVWPVHGSVLIREGFVWFAAGRSSYLDGGVRLFAWELGSLSSGFEQCFDGHDVDAWTQFQPRGPGIVPNMMPGTIPDILSSKGEHIYMGWTCFNQSGELVPVQEPHLFSATGFLDDSWWHRTYWQYGSWMKGGFGGWPQAARQSPAGRSLVFNEHTVFGYGRTAYDPGNPNAVHAGHVGLVKDTYQDSGRVAHDQNPQRLFAAPLPGRTDAVITGWEVSTDILPRAICLTGDVLWIAGPDAQDENIGLARLSEALPGRLHALDATTGTISTRQELKAGPVADGMAAVEGSLFISCTDGVVRCYRER